MSLESTLSNTYFEFNIIGHGFLYEKTTPLANTIRQRLRPKLFRYLYSRATIISTLHIFFTINSFRFQSGAFSESSNDSSGGGNAADAPAVEPSSDQMAMESQERETPSHAYNGPPPPAPPPHTRRQTPPHHQPHHPIGKIIDKLVSVL